MMFDRVLNIPLPGEERKDIKDAWLMVIDRHALTHPERF